MEPHIVYDLDTFHHEWMCIYSVWNPGRFQKPDSVNVQVGYINQSLISRQNPDPDITRNPLRISDGFSTC